MAPAPSGRVTAFQADGTGKTAFATDLGNPAGVLQLADGRILVAEVGTGRILVFQANGSGRAVFATGLSTNPGLTQLADGRVLAVSGGSGEVIAFQPDGTGRTAFATGLSFPLDVTQLADGRVLVSEAQGGRVTAFQPDGSGRAVFAAALSSPYGVTQLADGRVLVVEQGAGRVVAFAADGTGRAVFAAGPNLSFTTQLADGRVLVSGESSFQDNAGSVTAFPSVSQNLSLTKSDGGASVSPGGTVAYTLGYANAGRATGVAVTETVPANTTFNAGASTAGWACSPSGSAGSTCTLSLGMLASGSAGSVTFAVTVAASVPAGTTAINNTATISDDGANGPDVAPGDNTASDTTPLLGVATVTGVDLLVDTAADTPFVDGVASDAATSLAGCTDNVLDGDCSLREAISVAEANAALVRIGFEVTEANGAMNGVATILVETELPAVTRAGVTIDGYTQPGAVQNTLAVGTDAVLRVALVSGTTSPDVANYNGLTLTGSEQTVRGLAIGGFFFGINLVSTTNTVVAGTYLGLGVDGTTRVANSTGIIASGNPSGPLAGLRVGTDGDGVADAAERNVVSGNTGGIVLDGTTNTVVAGNYVGLNAAGTAAVANFNGITAVGATGRPSTGLRVGTDGDGTADAAERNVVSGNSGRGLFLDGTTDTVVAGNYVGLNAAGTAAVANSGSGIFAFGITDAPLAGLRVGTDGNGTADVAERNIVSGNGGSGISLQSTTDVVVAGNYVGLLADGTTRAANLSGILAFGTTAEPLTGLRIGTDGNGIADADERNVVAGSSAAGRSGIDLRGTTDVVVAGNYVGLGADGMTRVANRTGIFASGGGDPLTGLRIGTDGNGTADAAERNVVSGNSGTGIDLRGTTDAVVAGNYVGLGADGTTPVGNATGILAFGTTTGLRVGTDGDGVRDDVEANRIRGNTGRGVTVAFAQASVLGNDIAANGSATGSAGLGIDLNQDGVTPNDTGDGDEGPNGLQNFPEITSASTASVAFTLNSTATATFRVELFASAAADPSGYGEGERFLGFATVTTDASGDASGTFAPTGLAAGEFVTATATPVTVDGSGNVTSFPAGTGTSEFSLAVAATAPPVAETATRTDFATGLSTPFGLAQLADGRVLVSERDAERVSVLSTTGGRSDFATGLSGPRGLVRLADGRILVSEVNANRVSVLSATGERTDFATGLASPFGLTQLTDGRILVAELGASRVSLLSATGQRTDFATGLASPFGLTQLADGRILVAEIGADRVSVLSATGERTDFATGLSAPTALAQLADGRILVSEAGANRVSVLSATGGRSDFATGLSGPQGLVQLADGRILVAEDGANRVSLLTPPGSATVTQADLFNPSSAPGDGRGYRLLGAPVAGYGVTDLAALNLVQGVPAGANAATHPAQYPLAGTTSTPATRARHGVLYPPRRRRRARARPRLLLVALRPRHRRLVRLRRRHEREPRTDRLLALGDGHEPDGRRRGAFADNTGAGADDFQMLANPFARPLAVAGITASGGTLQGGIVQAYSPGGSGTFVTLGLAGDAVPDVLAVWQGAFAELVPTAAGGR